MLYDPKNHTGGESLFEVGRNCTAKTYARHGSMLVDCSNYYRDLQESLTKAKRSIFITGWDIDSRIELIRREDDKVHDTPVTLYELLTLKARENPDLQIYLNKWNYVFFMAEVREPLSIWKWRKTGLPNIHYCHDGMVPSGACHHQKIIVVDDEVAFIGGMDVAVNRWDTRDHIPEDPHREDPGGVYKPSARKKFPPYHDIQTVVSGDAARELAKISRERWKLASGYEAIPLSEGCEPDERGICPAWPDTDPPDFTNIDVAIARTLPSYAGGKERFEIEQAYLDEIATAEHFIYMENQYFTAPTIAQALNRRMHERPNLRILLVSSYDPQGFIEKVSMWSGRMKFKKMIEKGGRADQVHMAYPASKRRTSDGYQSIRIHSKIMIVDDKLLSVGSANLNKRSMKLDTECDLIYQAVTDEHRRKIADIRNDLIHEHSGLEKDVVAEMVEKAVAPKEFADRDGGNKKLVTINDKEFFARFPTFIADRLADPEKGWMPELLPLPYAKNSYIQYFSKRNLLYGLLFCVLVGIAAIFWKHGLLQEFGSREKLEAVFESIKNAPFGVVIATAFYTLCSLLFVPVTILTGVTAIIFGYWYGLLISLCGALACAAIGYGLGKAFGGRFPGLMASGAMERIKGHAENSNVMGITFLRLLPIAPFNVVNIALGFLKVPFMVFMPATLFGLLPGKIVAVFLADSVADLWRHPDWKTTAYVAGGLAGWAAVVWMTHYLYKLWQKRRGQEKPAEA